MRKCAIGLRKEATDEPGGIPQSARADPELRQAARTARKLEKDAQKWAKWTENGWVCNHWQRQQIVLLETGELEKRVKTANEAYGFGRGVEKTLTREQAIILEAFTNEQLAEYMQ